MKRLILSTIALSMLALPIAQAEAGPRNEVTRYEYQTQHAVKKPVVTKKVVVKNNKNVVVKKKVVKKHRWARGHKVPAWQRNYVVRDYYRYGLRRPAYGQQWVRVDNDFLLVSIASGIIAGIIAAH